ncbi:MAG: hypothetical protein HUK40_17240 [Desulfobacter sp.]|nr:hypothetical protein [Desulfobacter sp.]
MNGPHGKINFLALRFYEAWLVEKKKKNRVKFDPVFNYRFTGTKLGPSFRKIEGESVIRAGWFYPHDEFLDKDDYGAASFCLMGNKKLTFADWLIEGGFSADEPEIWMGLRHFFDPITGLYLTDFSHDWTTTIGNETVKRLTGRPEMDARTWALVGPAKNNFKPNPWTWEKGIGYMQKALACTDSPGKKDDLYAAAWRCLGETMHLMVDMTVPAHVRNDSHPGIWDKKNGLAPDPYEDFANEELIRAVWKKKLGTRETFPAIRDAVP